MSPPNVHFTLVETQWVTKSKRDEEGAVVKRKATSGAQGFVQEPGVVFRDIGSLAVHHDACRVVITLSIRRGWEMHKTNFDAAYPNSELRHTICDRIPQSADAEPDMTI